MADTPVQFVRIILVNHVEMSFMCDRFALGQAPCRDRDTWQAMIFTQSRLAGCRANTTTRKHPSA